MRIDHFTRATLIALVTLLLGSSIDYLTDLEASLGLDALFQMRGSRPPPAEVVVAMVETSRGAGFVSRPERFDATVIFEPYNKLC